MSSSRKTLESYLIPLEEIVRATENFSSDRYIGSGGFGKVYKGELSGRWQNRTAAIKRLDLDGFQGKAEFDNELKMISRFDHENVISLIGYCDEDSEMIIIYEYAMNGSIDYHLRYPRKRCCIDWRQRLKICIGAARGLNYLHCGLEEHERVIHRDIKSANILLDENLIAKVCDFGLSKLGTKDQRNTHLYTKVAGTHYYIDPTYQETGILTKESDVYSFGVVMFEVLSGMLVYSEREIGNGGPRPLMNFVRRYDDDNEPENLIKLIDPCLKDQIDSDSFNTFKETAYQCISMTKKKRPVMKTVVEKLEEALAIQENVEAFIECVTKDIGFIHGIPVAAFTIYKWLLHWKYFENEKTNVFDRLIQIIISAIEVQDNNNQRAYWLSNASALLFLIHKSLKPDSASLDPKTPPPTSLKMGFLSFWASGKVELKVVQQIEAKPPALLFEKNLTEYIQKLYDSILENLKKELGTLLAQAPRTSKRVLRSGESFGKDSQSNNWQGIVDRLNTLLNALKKNCVPLVVVKKIFVEIFSYINVQLFNSLLVHWECCTFSYGEYVKAGLAELDLWCSKAKEEYIGSACDELKHIKYAIEFMTLHQKYRLSDDDITDDLFPILSIQQMHRICTLYWDDNFNTRLASQDVISSMKILMSEDLNNGSSNSFLLKHTPSIPLTIDDLFSSLQVKDFLKVKPAAEYVKYQNFRFL